MFSDAGLAGESHHAIIPNPNVASDLTDRLSRLSADERRLFDMIATQFVMMLGPDHIYDRTEISIVPVIDGKPVSFSAAGRTTLEPDWLAVRAAMNDSDEEKEGDQDQDGQALPAVNDGDPARVMETELVTKSTKAPPRYTEGSLIDDMQNAWRYVNDPAEKERLKDAKGIGTPATRDTIIEGLKKQELILSDRGKLKASDTAVQLYEVLAERCPAILDPAETARMEARLDAVVSGEVSAVTVIDEICAAESGMIERLSGSAAKLAIKRAPTEKMIDAARAKAKREGIRLPPDVFRDHDACRTFLGPLPERSEGGQKETGRKPPSAAQLELAKKIAARRNCAVPAELFADAAGLSNWIETNNLASDKQLELVGKLLASKKILAPPGYPDKLKAADASKAIADGIGAGGRRH